MRRILAAALAFLLTVPACGAASSVGPTASADISSPATETPLATASPSAAPTPTPIPPLRPDAVAEVVTTDLVVRSAPGTGDASEIYPGRLAAPTLLFILDGPVAADGYDWYQVAPFEESFSDTPPEWLRLGWVAAASREGEPWIAPWAGDCPDPTLDAIHGQPYFLLLACFGAQPLTLEGMFDCCFVADPAVISPSWLAHTGGWLFPFDWEPEGVFSGGLVLRFNEVDRSYGHVPVQVVGHFDDAAARTCREEPQPGDEATPPELVILGCRSQFVVTDVTATQAP